MSRKPKFRPEIRRIKLNPEQAVLFCACYSQGKRYSGTNQAGWRIGVVACGGGAAKDLADAPMTCDFLPPGGFSHWSTSTVGSTVS